jgi:hypothetical protein
MAKKAVIGNRDEKDDTDSGGEGDCEANDPPLATENHLMEALIKARILLSR